MKKTRLAVTAVAVLMSGVPAAEPQAEEEEVRIDTVINCGGVSPDVILLPPAKGVNLYIHDGCMCHDNAELAKHDIRGYASTTDEGELALWDLPDDLAYAGSFDLQLGETKKITRFCYTSEQYRQYRQQVQSQQQTQ